MAILHIQETTFKGIKKVVESAPSCPYAMPYFLHAKLILALVVATFNVVGDSKLSFLRVRETDNPLIKDKSPKVCLSHTLFALIGCRGYDLFYDGGEYKILAKENELLQKIFDFCMDHGFEDVAYIGNADNERSYMHF